MKAPRRGWSNSLLMIADLKEENMAKKKPKELCKWKQDDIKKNLDDFSDIVRNPKFVCSTSVGVSRIKNNLDRGPTSWARSPG